jgi:hypothetical protein
VAVTSTSRGTGYSVGTSRTIDDEEAAMTAPDPQPEADPGFEHDPERAETYAEAVGTDPTPQEVDTYLEMAGDEPLGDGSDAER